MDIEKNKFVQSSTDKDFIKPDETQVRPIPFQAIIYNLTQLFHCTPSQLLQEDNNLIMEILAIHNTYGEIEDKIGEAEKANSKNKIKMDMRRITIALELEKLKSK